MHVRGHEVLMLENRWLRVSVLPGKGADIAEFLYKPTDTDFLWRSPWPLRGASSAHPLGSSPDTAFLDSYHGGWQEMFPICGSAADYGGMRIGVHGEVCLLPWEWTVEEDTPERVTLRFDVATLRSPFRLCRRMTLRYDRAALLLEERVLNDGSTRQHFMWGHHPAFGAPFLKSGCRIDTDARTVLTTDAHEDPASRLAPNHRSEWPLAAGIHGERIDLSRIEGPECGAHDWAYLTDFDEGWFAIRDPEQEVGFACRWPAHIFPFALLWQNYRGAQSAPWYGRAYTIALEPQSTFPADYAQGAPLLGLDPGETLDLALVAVAFEATEPVTAVSNDGVVS